MNTSNGTYKGKMARVLLLAAMATFVLPAAADDSILYHRLQYAGACVRYNREAFASAPLRSYLPVPSLSEISVSGFSQPSATAQLPQLGTGGRFFNVEASSLQHLGKGDVVWGNASYRNGRKYDVTWNETSDFLQLYPYVLADGRGGDLKYEEYRLDGGYSAHKGRVSYGADLGYRALSEYRDSDPRPNNTVADLYARLGAGYELSCGYVVALTADAGKYKQTNELAYYNELGAQKEYHLTGIGNDFARFSGQSNNCFNKGYNLGAELSLASTGVTGWMAQAGYMYTQREKVLSDLNRLPLNTLDIHTVRAALGYNTKQAGARLSGKYSMRNGTDNLFGDATGSVYPQIGSVKQYEAKALTLTADGYWSLAPSRHLLVDILPSVAYTSFESSHRSSGNSLDSRDIRFGICGSMSYIRQSYMLAARAEVARRQNLSSVLNLYNSIGSQMTEALQNINRYFVNGQTDMSLGAEYTRRLWGGKALSVGIQWCHSFYLSTGNNRYEAKVAFTL